MIQHLKDIALNLTIAGGFGSVCGGLSYMLKVEEGKPFKWRELILHMSISAVCGLISYTLLENLAELNPSVCGAFSGIAGWMGTRFIRIIEVRIQKRMGG